MPTLILGFAAAEQRRHSRQSHVDALLLLTISCGGAVPLTSCLYCPALPVIVTWRAILSRSDGRTLACWSVVEFGLRGTCDLTAVWVYRFLVTWATLVCQSSLLAAVACQSKRWRTDTVAGSDERLHGLCPRAWHRVAGSWKYDSERSQAGVARAQSRQCSCGCDQGNTCLLRKAPEIKGGVCQRVTSSHVLVVQTLLLAAQRC